MSTAPKMPPTRDQVIDVVETLGRHLDAKIDAVKTELSARIDRVEAKVDKLDAKVGKLAEVSQENDVGLNRKLDAILKKLGA